MVLWALVACWSEKDQEADLDGGIGSRPWGEWAGGLVDLWAGGPSNDVNELGQWTGQQRTVEPALVPPSTRPRTIINRRRRISAA